MRSHPYNKATCTCALLAAACPSIRHFQYFNDRIFPLENPDKDEELSHEMYNLRFPNRQDASF